MGHDVGTSTEHEPQLVGRQRELERLAALLERERLVTITGPAGIGKSALLAAHLARAPDQPATAVQLVDTGDAQNVDELLRAIASSLSIELPSGVGDGEAIALVGRALQACGPLTLALDGVDQLTTSCRAIVERWLAACPQLRLVLSSRSRLQLEREAILELGPLRCPELADGDTGRWRDAPAIELLIRCAVQAGGEAVIQAAEPAQLIELVRAIDGIPLALEVVAARTRVAAIDELLERLPERVSLLETGASGAPSLRRALDAAWSLASVEQRRALLQLSAFEGWFSLEAAEAMLAPVDGEAFDASEGRDLSALQLLDSLIAQSLLRSAAAPSGGGMRFHFYAPIRSYLHHIQLGDEQRKQLRLRHAEIVVEHGEALRDADRIDELERSSVELAAVTRHGLRDASSEAATLVARALLLLDVVRSRRGPFTDHLQRLTDGYAAACAAGVDPRLQVRLELALANARHHIGDSARIESYEHARRQALELGDSALALAISERLVFAYVDEERLEDAEQLAESAIAEARGTQAGRLEAWLRLHLSRIARRRAEYEAALTQLQRAHGLFRTVRDARGEAEVLTQLGLISEMRGQAAEATSSYLRAAQLLEELDERRDGAIMQINLARIAHASGELDAAESRYREARLQLQRLGDGHSAATCDGGLGLIATERGDRTAAIELLRAARDQLDPASETQHRTVFGAMLAAVLASDGAQPEAELVLAEAERGAAAEHAQYSRLVEICREVVDTARPAGQQPGSTRPSPTDEQPTARTRPRVAGTEPEVTSAAERAASTVLARLRRRAEDAERSRAAVTISPDASTLQLASGDTVALHRRREARAVLARLVAARRDQPGVAVPSAELVDAGWGGQSLDEATARNRLHVTLARLRKLGLKGSLVAADDGYLLDPEIARISRK